MPVATEDDPPVTSTCTTEASARPSRSPMPDAPGPPAIWNTVSSGGFVVSTRARTAKSILTFLPPRAAQSSGTSTASHCHSGKSVQVCIAEGVDDDDTEEMTPGVAEMAVVGEVRGRPADGRLAGAAVTGVVIAGTGAVVGAVPAQAEATRTSVRVAAPRARDLTACLMAVGMECLRNSTRTTSSRWPEPTSTLGGAERHDHGRTLALGGGEQSGSV